MYIKTGDPFSHYQVTSRLWPVGVPKRLPPAVELAHTAVPKIRFLSMGGKVFHNLPGNQHDVTRTVGFVLQSLSAVILNW